MPHNRDIYIIGSGMAAYSLLREIRKIDKQIGITLICADSGDFYSKPMLSNALAQNKTADMLVSQSAQAMVEAQDFELINNTHISSINTIEQTVHSDDQSWHYQHLVLATGANPIRIPMQGDAVDDVMTVNHLDDYRLFRNKLEQADRIAIIGPGLIGCEFANDLSQLEKQISVIGPDAWPISTLLPEQSGLFLQQKLQQIGIQFYLQNTVQSVNKACSSYQLTLKDGQQLEADLVLSAVGLRADVELAQDNQIETSKGIITDRFLRSSVENIYALGDCAEVSGFHLPFIMPIMHAARALAKTLTGSATEVSYPAMPVAIKTPACPLVVSPSADPQAELSYQQTEDGIKALYQSGDELKGFALAGDTTSEKQTLTRSLPALF